MPCFVVTEDFSLPLIVVSVVSRALALLLRCGGPGRAAGWRGDAGPSPAILSWYAIAEVLLQTDLINMCNGLE